MLYIPSYSLVSAKNQKQVTGYLSLYSYVLVTCFLKYLYFFPVFFGKVEFLGFGFGVFVEHVVEGSYSVCE